VPGDRTSQLRGWLRHPHWNNLITAQNCRGQIEEPARGPDCHGKRLTAASSRRRRQNIFIPLRPDNIPILLVDEAIPAPGARNCVRDFVAGIYPPVRLGWACEMKKWLNFNRGLSLTICERAAWSSWGDDGRPRKNEGDPHHGLVKRQPARRPINFMAKYGPWALILRPPPTSERLMQLGHSSRWSPKTAPRSFKTEFPDQCRCRPGHHHRQSSGRRPRPGTIQIMADPTAVAERPLFSPATFFSVGAPSPGGRAATFGPHRGRRGTLSPPGPVAGPIGVPLRNHERRRHHGAELPQIDQIRPQNTTLKICTPSSSLPSNTGRGSARKNLSEHVEKVKAAHGLRRI